MSAPLSGNIVVREVVTNFQYLHADEAYCGSFFQVVSQFSLFEMVGPTVSPERGTDCCENDLTWAPAAPLQPAPERFISALSPK